MESLGKIIRDKYGYSTYKLEKDFDECYNNNVMFKKVVDSLKLPKGYLMRYTSKIENTAKELKNCQNCKNIMECKNEVMGYVYYPEILNENLVFDYVACKRKKKLDEKNLYQKNVYVFDIPKEIREASMKNIDTTDANRFEVIKWIKNYLDNYKKGVIRRGIYLTGNFGCGKTYLLSAMLNEIAKLGGKVAIVYYPDFLRKLKEGFSDDSYYELVEQVRKIPFLLLDDIGAETVTSWSRDDVLGPILQYRMQEQLPTFFTSNLTLAQLEVHLSLTKVSVDEVKARRIMERIRQLSDIVTMVSENKREKERNIHE